jgi:hypothetical protein
MASTSVVLDIRANTQKALGEFKKFSAQLDNKFLISGLKLDVVRNALSQINKEFQRAIGEQGLTAAQSMKGAETQAAVLLDTFKNVGLEAGLSLSKNISESLAQVAVTAGGTAEDIKSALAATPFISQTLGEDLRKQLSSGILEFQRDLRRAGLGEEFGNIAKDILSGQADILQLVNSGTPIGSLLGKELLDRGGVVNLSELTPAKRTELLAEILNDKSLRDLIQRIGKETSGYRGILEDLNTNLFNPRKGVFGYLRDVSLSVEGITTNVFKETTKLVETIFGPEGLFLNFFRNIAKVFGIEDPLRFIIRNIRFLTEQFERLNKFIQSESFQNIIKQIREAFERTKKFFVNIYDAIINNDEESQQSVIQSIKNIGESVREFISKIAGVIRGEDISNESDKITTIAGTLIDEIGKTLILLINEVGEALLQKAGTIAGDIATKLPGIVAGLFSKLFEGDGILGKALGGLIIARVGLAITRALGGINRTRTGPGGFTGAASRYIFGGPFDLSRRGGRGGGFPITGSTQPRTISPLGRVRNNLLARSLAARDIAQSYITRTPTSSVRRRPRGDIFGIERRKRYEEAQRKRSRMLRERAVRNRRITPSTSVFAGTINPSYIERRGMNYEDFVLPQGRPIDRRITAKTTMFTPPTAAELFPYVATDDPINNPKLREVNRQRYIEEAEFNRKIRSRQSVRQRFSRRYGRRAGLGAQMAQLRRGMPKVGRASLITGGLALGGLGLMGLFGGSGAQAAEGEIDPMTDMPLAPKNKKMGAGQAWGSLGAGVAEGAIMGSMFGPWGAAIGGVIGAGISLMDEEVRNAIGESISKFVSGMGEWMSDMGTKIKDAVMGGFETIKNWASNIDWKNVLLDAILPGRGLARTVAQSTGASEDDGWMAKTIRFLTGARKGNADGANFIGPTLAQESRMSGTKAMVVNDREFVIPQGGFSTLANLVALKNTPSALVSGAAGANAAPQINLTINVSGVFSADDLEDTLRDPVSNIVEDAYNRAASAKTNQVNTRA